MEYTKPNTKNPANGAQYGLTDENGKSCTVVFAYMTVELGAGVDV